MQSSLCSVGLGKTVKAYYPSITTTLIPNIPLKLQTFLLSKISLGYFVLNNLYGATFSGFFNSCFVE